MSRNVDWSESVGERPYRVIAEERVDRGRKVYLRWREGGNWKVLATDLIVRNNAGKIVKSRVQEALRAAKVRSEDLAAGKEVAGRSKRPLTISQGLRRAIHPEEGKYPSDTMHRREVIRELERAAAFWGDRAWNSIKPGDIRALYRGRAKALVKAGHIGRRGAEVTVSRVLAVAEWLRGEGLIEAGACHPPKDWQKELGSEVTTEPPSRPRHTLEEVRAILRVAPEVDPRFNLLMRLSIGLRPGQVRRVTRRMLDLEGRTLRVVGRGRKGGTLVVLLDEDVALVQAALDGYLAPLEEQYRAGAVTDYPLFPQGKLTGRTKNPRTARCRPDQAEAGSIGEYAVRTWFRKAEELAGIDHVDGRGTYGIKRQSVDEAKRQKISRDELASLGGWATTEMADRIYADQEARDAAEGAARARAKIRGELEPVTPEA